MMYFWRRSIRSMEPLPTDHAPSPAHQKSATSDFCSRHRSSVTERLWRARPGNRGGGVERGPRPLPPCSQHPVGTLFVRAAPNALPFEHGRSIEDGNEDGGEQQPEEHEKSIQADEAVDGTA